LKNMRPLYRRISAVVAAAVFPLVITAFAAGVWGALISLNLKTSPAIPWAVPAMALILWLLWQYLGGRWWPRSTSESRRTYLRANWVQFPVFVWAFLAGVLSIIALAGLWIVLFQLVKMTPNALPSAAGYPLLTIVLALVMASLVAPFSEEAAFRGYSQVILEREFSTPIAVVVSSVFFALAHLTHGLFWPKLLVYFLVGVTFAVTATLTKSTLPAIPVHFVGDMVFFIFVWPHDAARRLVSEAGADANFWIHVAQIIICTPLAMLAFRRLAKASGESPTGNRLTVP
jgi:membrane protease YdiL (CAAX protease family)